MTVTRKYQRAAVDHHKAKIEAWCSTGLKVSDTFSDGIQAINRILSSYKVKVVTESAMKQFVSRNDPFAYHLDEQIRFFINSLGVKVKRSDLQALENAVGVAIRAENARYKGGFKSAFLTATMSGLK